MAGAWRVRSGTGTGFCFKAVPVSWERIQEGSKIADGSAEYLLLKLVLSGPSELGAELSNCQDILPFLAS